MGNDPFGTGYLIFMGFWVAVFIVMQFWPIVRVPMGQFGVEIVGDKRQATTVVEQGQRGIQPRLLQPGERYFWWRRNVTHYNKVVIRDHYVGVVTAHVGIESRDKIAKYNPLFGDFDVVEAFVAHGGQQGVQAFLLPPGTYIIHPSAFTVVQHDEVVINDDTLGVITAHIGAESTDSTAPYDHRFGDFTDVNAFLEAGGRQGVQEPFLRPGTYAIHPVAFEVTAIGGEDEDEHKVYGEFAEASDVLSEIGTYTVQTERGTAIVVEPEGDSITVQAVGFSETLCERILQLVIRPTGDVTIEWEVAINLDAINGDQTAAEVLRLLAQEAFDNSRPHWSLVEFIAKLSLMEQQMRGIYRARINEAVMLPTATARKN